MMEGNEMFLLLLVFVCQGVLGGQMKFFCVFGCVMVGWYELFRGKCWLFGGFWGLGLLFGSLRRAGCG